MFQLFFHGGFGFSFFDPMDPQKEYLVSSQWYRSSLIICIYFVHVRDTDEEEWQYLGPLTWLYVKVRTSMRAAATDSFSSTIRIFCLPTCKPISAERLYKIFI